MMDFKWNNKTTANLQQRWRRQVADELYVHHLRMSRHVWLRKLAAAAVRSVMLNLANFSEVAK